MTWSSLRIILWRGCLRLHKVEDGTLSVDPLKLATRLVVA